MFRPLTSESSKYSGWHCCAANGWDWVRNVEKWCWCLT